MTQIPNESTELQIRKTARFFECVRQGFGTTSALTRKKIQKVNEGKTISKTVFCQSVCRCIKDPGAHSCVDLYLSGLYHLMQGIRNAIVQRESVKERLDNCECKRHKNARDAIELNYEGGDPPVMWEDYLSRSPGQIIRATCCPARDELASPCFAVRLVTKAVTHDPMEVYSQRRRWKNNQVQRVRSAEESINP
jgi:hypothetical protein